MAAQSGGAGGSLVKVGTGTLTIDGAGTYTGGTTVSGGALVVGDFANPYRRSVGRRTDCRGVRRDARWLWQRHWRRNQ